MPPDNAGYFQAAYTAIVVLYVGYAVLLVPFIHLSVELFRTMHPKAIVLKPSAPSLPGEMLQTLLLGFAATLLLFVALLRARLRYANERELLSLHREED